VTQSQISVVAWAVNCWRLYKIPCTVHFKFI